MRGTSAPDLSPYICRYGVIWLGEDPDARHRRLDGTVVFTDLSGFTALSERLTAAGRVGAEEMATRLDNVFTSLLAEARDRGGSLVHFGGDALALLFTGEHHEVRGVATAAAMNKALKPHARMPTPSGVVKLGMSTGVWSGDVDLFLLGSRSRQLLIAGPAATGVTALEGAASSGEVLLSARTAAALPASGSRPWSAGAMMLARAPQAPAWTAPDIPTVDTSKLLPVALRRHLLTGGGEPEHRSVTMAFIRWTGMDALIAREGPERVGQRLDELVARTEELTLEWGIAFLASDLSGDGGKLLVAAGVPVLHEDDETRALLCMRALAAEDPGGLGVRIGMHRGHAFAAAVGAPFRRTYTCIGDTVNTAARVMVRAEPGQVLATDDVLARSSRLFATVALPEFAAKGKALPLQAFVIGEDQGPRIVDASGVMVGREPETALLCEAARTAGDDAARVVSFVGEGGAGKTRLLRHAMAQLADVHVLETVCASHLSDDPYSTFRPVLVQALAGRTVAEVTPALVPWAPLVALVTGEETESTDDVDRLDPRFVTDKLHQVVAELLDVCVPDAAVVVVDDTQWADQASTALLEHLLGRPIRRWAAWLAGRPETTPRFGEPTFALQPLPDEDALRLVRAHAPMPLTPQHAAALVERAAGNPLFLRELARTATVGIDTVSDLPADLESIVGARIDRLAPTDRDLLSVASVIGPVFDDDIVEQVAPQATEPSAWERLSDFVEAAPPGRRHFRNAVYQQVAYARLPYRQRRDLHGEVGARIEKRDGTAAPPDQMSIHMSAAQEWDAAWHWSLKAADVAAHAYARVEEVHALERAITAGRRAGKEARDVRGAMWRLATTATSGGQSTLAIDTLVRIVRESEAPEQARGFARLAMLYGETGQRDRQMRAVRRGLALVQDDQTAVKADLLTNRALDDYRAGRHRAFEKSFAAALEACGPEDHTARGELWMIAGVEDLSLLRDSTEAFTTARRHHLEAGDVLKASVADSNLAIGLWEQGLWQKAKDVWIDALQRQSDVGYVAGAGWTAANLAELCVDQGDLDAAQAYLDTAHACGQSSGSQPMLALIQVFEAALLQRRLELDRARAVLDDIVVTDPEAGRMFDQRAAEMALLECRGQLPPLTADWPAPPPWADRFESIALMQRGEEVGLSNLRALIGDDERPALERAMADEARSRVPGEAPRDPRFDVVFADRGITAVVTFPVRPGEQPGRRTL